MKLLMDQLLPKLSEMRAGEYRERDFTQLRTRGKEA